MLALKFCNFAVGVMGFDMLGNLLWHEVVGYCAVSAIYLSPLSVAIKFKFRTRGENNLIFIVHNILVKGNM